MGFRSTFALEHYNIDWPKWFIDKYEGSINFHGGLITPKRECKTYSVWGNLPEDIQKSIDWSRLSLKNIILVYLHECGGVTRFQIAKDSIKISESDSWIEVDEIVHNYCYGCSDI